MAGAMDEAMLVEALKATAHPLRLRILTVLQAGELNVGDIETASGIGQPALSQQLGVLRKAGLVSTRKDAKLVYYRLAQDRLTAIAGAMSALAGPSSAGPSDPGQTRRTGAPGAANFARLA